MAQWAETQASLFQIQYLIFMYFLNKFYVYALPSREFQIAMKWIYSLKFYRRRQGRKPQTSSNVGGNQKLAQACLPEDREVMRMSCSGSSPASMLSCSRKTRGGSARLRTVYSLHPDCWDTCTVARAPRQSTSLVTSLICNPTSLLINNDTSVIPFPICEVKLCDVSSQKLLTACSPQLTTVSQIIYQFPLCYQEQEEKLGVVHCCVINHPQTSRLKPTTIYQYCFKSVCWLGPPLLVLPGPLAAGLLGWKGQGGLRNWLSVGPATWFSSSLVPRKLDWLPHTSVSGQPFLRSKAGAEGLARKSQNFTSNTFFSSKQIRTAKVQGVRVYCSYQALQKACALVFQSTTMQKTQYLPPNRQVHWSPNKL